MQDLSLEGRCGGFLTRKWSYTYPILLLLFSSSFQYLIIVDFHGNIDSIVRLFTVQDADCQLPLALLCGPYIATVEFFSQNNLEKQQECLSRMYISLKEVQKKTLVFL